MPVPCIKRIGKVRRKVNENWRSNRKGDEARWKLLEQVF
jgi:hypothetical protein